MTTEARDISNDDTLRLTVPMPPPIAHLPTGLGMYIFDLSRAVQGTPEEAARRASSAGLRFVAICACWQEDGRHGVMNEHDLDDYGAAFRAAGIEVFVWGYPWGTAECVRKFTETMREAADKAGAIGIILDPELGFKGERARFMRPLLDLTLDSLNERIGLGFTSYGLTSAHKDFPWQVAGGFGWGSPQLYTVPLGVARMAIEQWRKHGWNHLLASVPTFGPNSENQLAAYAGAILEHCEGAIFWQWRGTSLAEWRVIEALANRYGAVPARSSFTEARV